MKASSNFFLLSLILLISNVFAEPINLGQGAEYNAIVFGDFTASSSDVEGQLAVQGDVNINHYSVGDKLDSTQLHDVLVSGGDITYPSGRVYYGNILAAGSVNGIGSAVTNGMEPGSRIEGNAILPIDFNEAYNELSTLSQSLRQLPSNTTFDSQWGGLYLHGDCSSDTQVFDLDGSVVHSSHTFQVDCIPNDAYVIFNVSGQSTGLTNMSLSSLEAHREKVIFNFYEASSLTLAGIGVEGTVLAPYADINNPQGVIKGQLIAKSWNGMMQINNNLFEGQVAQGNQAPVTQDQIFDISVDEVLDFTLSANDIHGDNLTYTIISNPQFGNLQGTVPDFEYTPLLGFTGIDTFTYQVNDGELDSEVATVTFNVGKTQCELYPYSIEFNQLQNLQIGDQVNNYATATGSGNYSLLTWDGANDTNTLASSFTMPGDSHNYINPDDAYDSNINTDDWVQGAPGKNNANHVRNALDALIGQQITVPVWSDTRGAGSNFDYLVADFAIIELTAYKLNGQSSISFIYHGKAACGNYAPFTLDAGISTEQNAVIDLVLSDKEEVNHGVQNLLAVIDADENELEYIITVQPAHGTLTGTGPEFNYAPNPGYYGPDSFDFKVNDGSQDSNTSTISIEVIQTNVAPVAFDQSIHLLEDESINLTLTAEDADNDVLSFNLETLPSNGQITGTAPDLIYTPTAGFSGLDTLTFTVNDGLENSNLATINIEVIAVNDAPEAVNISVTTDEDTSINLTLLGSDPEGDTLTYQLISQPSNGILSGTAPNLGYTPNADFNGSDAFTFLVNDGQLDSAIATVNITVNPINDAPVADPVIITVDEDDSVQIILSGTDVDGDVLSFIIDSQPNNGTLTGSGNSYTYTPNLDENGNDTFTYHVNDGTVDSAAVSVNITVNAGNDAPTASDLDVTVDEDNTASITLSGSDPDGDTLTYTVLTQSANGTLTGTAPNLTYTPNANYNGTDIFTYSVNDGALDSNVATVSINVNPINDAPVADPVISTVDEDGSVQIILSGSDVDGDVLSFIIDSQPNNGSLTGTGANLTYTPNSNFSGTGAFTYHVNDGTVDSEIVTVTITVNAINDVPIANDINLQTDQNQTVNITLTGSDPDSNSLSYLIDTQPSNGNLSGSGSSYIYTPNTDFSGVDTFTYHVNDGQADSTQATVTVTIDAVNQAPTANDLNLLTDEDTHLPITLLASDPESDALTYVVQSQPNHGQLSDTGDNLMYTPNADYHGSDSFSYLVNDGSLDSNVATVTISISPINDEPVADDLNITVDEDGSVSFTLSGSDTDGDALTYVIGNQPSNGVLTGSGNSYTYSPNPDDNGNDTFTYHVNDGTVDSETVTVTITVNAINDAPVADAIQLTTLFETAVELPLLGNDVEDASVSFQIETLPANGTITESNGIYTYTPNAGYSGDDQATYVAIDSQGLASEPVLVEITVDGNSNQPPVITSGAPTDSTVGIDIQYDVEATDPDGDELTFGLDQSPVNATINGSSGMISWTPDPAHSLGIQSENTQCQSFSNDASDYHQVQLITIIDGSGSMIEEHVYLSTWLPQLNGEMLSVGLGQGDEIEFAVGRFSKSGLLNTLLSGEIFGDIDDISNQLFPITDLEGSEDGSSENGVNSMIDILEDYTYSETAQQIFIMMTDERCDSCPNQPERTVLLNQMLAERSDVLHSIVPTNQMLCPDGREVMGIDHQYQGFVAEPNGGFSVCQNATFENLSDSIFEHYVEPAFLTSGSVWNINLLSGESESNRSASESIAQVLAKITQQQTSTENQSDLSFSNISQVGTELYIDITNKGLSISSPYELQIQDGSSNQQIINLLELPVGSTETVVINASAFSTGDLSLSLLTPSDCVADNNQINITYFDVSVTDNSNGSDNQVFYLTANENNIAPTIEPISDRQILAGIPLTLAIQATDPNKGDALSYSIDNGPEQATISQNGLFRWTPVSADVGQTFFVSITVTDLAGISTQSSFSLDVIDEISPLWISSEPNQSAFYGTLYNYQLAVNHDPLSEIEYELLNGAPGMTLDQQGLLTWAVPAQPEIELITVIVNVSDQYNNFDNQAFVLILDESPAPPIIVSKIREPVEVGEHYSYQGLINDINALEEFELEFLYSPSSQLYFNNFYQPSPDFQYEEVNAYQWWGAPNTELPEYFDNSNHFCGTGDNGWKNLTPQIVETIDLGARGRNSDTFAGNLLATSLTDTNGDGQTNKADKQYIIYTRDYGVAAMDSVTLEDVWFQPSVRAAIGGYGHPMAAADINNDGEIETLVLDTSGFLNALSSDGDVLWTSSTASHYSNATKSLVSTTDLEGDGDLEILAGSYVYDHLGNTVIDFGYVNFAKSYGNYTLAADIDHDGFQEIFYNDAIYRHDGTILFGELGETNFYAAANFDEDVFLEWVQVNKGDGAVKLYDHDATVLWEHTLQSATLPNIADVNLDGVLDVVMTYSLISGDGTIIRDEDGDNRHDSVLTDLNQDGAFELISSWEQLYARDPITGDKIFEWKRTRGFYDFVLVDRFHTGEYEIFFPHWANRGNIYLDVINAADGGWTGGPGETQSSLFNKTLTKEGFANKTHGVMLEQMVENHLLPDFHVTGPQISETQSGHEVYTTLSNITPSLYQGDINVHFYHTAIDPANLMGSTLVNGIDVNERKHVVLDQVFDSHNPPGTTFFAVVEPVDVAEECRTVNNSASSEYVLWRVTDKFGLYDEQAFNIRMKYRDFVPYGVETITPAVALSPYQETLAWTGYNSGNHVNYVVYTKPENMQISASGDISWTPRLDQVGTHDLAFYVTNETLATRWVSTTITVEQPLNLPPYFTSIPTSGSVIDLYFEYQLTAIDPEGGALDFALIQSPTGMEISNEGLVTWTATLDQLGQHPIEVQVIDDHGHSDIQLFNLDVSNTTNQPPEISSSPDLTPLVIGDVFSYQLTAEDPENDAIDLLLIDGPATASMDTQGLLSYTTDTTGTIDFTVEARDANGAWSQQNFKIHVNDTANTPPQITSSPPQSQALDGSDYSYQVVAVDAENDALSYRLLQAPLGMRVDYSGLITWPANQVNLGRHVISIEVVDGRGGFVTQTYDLFIGNGNIGPVIDSVPPVNAVLNRLYQYEMEVIDPDSSPLLFELVDAPSGMVVDEVGLISWTPATLGEYPVTVQVSDETSFVRQTWNITVTEIATQLDVQVTVTPTTIQPNESVNVSVVVVAATGNVNVEATLDGTSVVLDANFQAQVSSNQIGSHVIEVTVTDDIETITTQVVFVVSDVIDNLYPEVDILTPEDGATITGFNDIQVRVQDDNLESWKLSYRYAEDDFTGRVTLAEGTGNIDDAIVAEWDTSLLRNGIYILLIEGTDVNGQRSSIAHSVFLEGDLKLGHFSIAFEDMNIPVAGIPITITRGYDTRDRNRDRAFGKGWSIGYQSVRVQESRVPGLAWYMETGFYSIGPVRLPRYCIQPAGERLVSVLLPDGGVEKFKVKARTINPSSAELSNCQNITPPEYFSIEFLPQGDTNSTITSTTGQSGLNILNGNLEELAADEPIDPNQYTLTMLDGTEYSLDQGFNVRKVKATSGHELRFTENGIEHSGGMSVSFIRDVEGRITRIEKADGMGVDYAYDANGDLTSFTDLNGNTTTYTYIQDHYLEDIIDPRGITVARNEYDVDGRLIAHIDAMGNRIEYDNDLIAMTSTITDRRGNSTVNAFDNAGNIIAQTNALGETTSYEYNHLRLETAKTNHLGHRTEWTYDAQGNQLTETDPLGHVTTSTYNRKAELLTQVDALGNPTIVNEYNPDYNPLTPSNPQHGYAQLKQVTDALGRTTQFHWRSGINSETGESLSVNTGFTDAAGNRYDITPLSGGTTDGLSGASTDLNGLRTETTYDDEARPLTESQIITDAGGNTIATYTTSYEYNANGDVIKTTDTLGNITRTEYNALNKVSATIDALGRRTEMEYDDRGNQILTRYPDGSTETMVYDEENNVTESTDRAGRTTKTIYDALNRAVAVIQPDDTPADDTDNPMTVNEYDAAGRMVATSDALGNTTRYEYDDAGRRTKTIDPLGRETTSVYDALGRRTQSTDALGRITTFEYNALGNLVKTNFANGTNTTTTYDSLSRKVAETDLAGLQTQYEYSAAGNLTAVIDSLGQRTEYGYDQRGNKLTQTDARGNTTSWAYDALNRVTSRTLPLGEVESYTYNEVGNRISKTDFNGETTTYEYNNLNQLVKTTYADLTTVVNSYNISGQMTSVTESNGITSYTYDVQNRLARIDYPIGSYIEYGYDANGNRTQVKTANQTVDYTFDALNRLETVADASGTTTYTYDAVGNRATQTNANGTVATYSYDNLNRLTDLVHKDSTNTTIASYEYELGANGNRLSLTEATGRIVEYSYDNLYRLITETVTDSINGNHFSQWSYDAVGNRLQQEIDGVVTTYSYDDNDRLLSETENSITTTYVYDDNGNTLEKTVDGLLDTQYTYSKDNRMLTADTGTSIISYSYDAGGIRQSQTVDGITTNFLVDPNRSYAQVLEESGVSDVTYTYGDDLISQTRGGIVTTYGYDGLGSTRILTDSSGVVQNSYGYQAFGELDYQFGTLENNYLFTGEQYDNNVGFYYLRARYYNPEIGRFSQMDVFPGMALEPVTLHKYLYANVNPVSLVDPSGYIGIFGIADIGFSVNSSSIIRTTSFSAARKQFSRILFGRPPKELGLVGELILDNAIGSVLNLIGIDSFKNKGAAGTRAHKNLENRLKGFEPIAGVTVHPEIFFDENGGEGSKREKGTLGIDILIKYKGKNVMGLDLKIGRGFSKKKRKEISRRGGDIPIVQIFIGVKTKK